MDPANPVPAATGVQVAGFEIDLLRGELRTLEGAYVYLRPRSFAALRLLANNPGRLVTKDEFMTKVWDDAIVTEDSLTQCVADIRRALQDEDRRIVRTVPRRGYLLMVETALTKDDCSKDGVPAASAVSPMPELPPVPPVVATQRLAPTQRLMWIAGALVTLLVAATAAFWPPSWRTPHELPGRAPDRPALAVLPFKAIIPEPKNKMVAVLQGYQIFSELARNRDLRISAWSASLELWLQQNLSPSEIGARLRVRYVVDGTVQRYGDQLAIDVHLVDVRDGTIALAQSFRVAAEQLGKVEPEISRKITQVLHSGMRQAEKQIILRRSPRDLDVYELTLQGLALKHRFNADAIRTGRRGLQEALRRDPDYAPAWAAYAWLNLVDLLNQLTGEWTLEQLDSVIEDFNRSVELDADSATAYQGLSKAWLHKGDLDQSLRLIRKAAELAPSDTDNLLYVGWTVLQKGEVQEGLRIMDEALDLNPIRPTYYYRHYAEALWAAKRYEASLEQSEECLRKAPEYTYCHIFRMLALVGLGRKDAAATAYRNGLLHSPNLDKAITLVIPPHPELAGRFREDLATLGWKRPS